MFLDRKLHHVAPWTTLGWSFWARNVWQRLSLHSMLSDVEISHKRARRKNCWERSSKHIEHVLVMSQNWIPRISKKTSVIWAILFWDTVSRQVSKCPPLLIPTIDSGMSLFRVKIYIILCLWAPYSIYSLASIMFYHYFCWLKSTCLLLKCPSFAGQTV